MRRAIKKEEIPSFEELLDFWDHLNYKKEENEIKWRDLIFLGLLILYKVKKVEILNLKRSDIDLFGKKTIKFYSGSQPINSRIYEQLKHYCYFLEETNEERLFNMSYRSVYNLVTRWTYRFFGDPISPLIIYLSDRGGQNENIS